MKKLAAALLGLSCIVPASLVSCQQAPDPISKVSLVAVQVSKEKWSFVDDQGQIIFEDEFKNEPTLVYNDVFSVREKDKYTVYKVTADKYDVLGDLDGLVNVGYLEEDFILATLPKQRITAYDASGHKKFEFTPVNGKEVTRTAIAYSEGLLPFSIEDDKIGYFDTKGQVAIKPAYDRASLFNGGFAVVGKTDDEADKTSYSVIDKKGGVVFKIKDGQTPRFDNFEEGFSYGYLIVGDDDRDVLYDTKGEVTRFPAKVTRIRATNGKYVIFVNEDLEYGVCDMAGEIIVRPKYSDIGFNGEEGFVAMKDDECLLLNLKGEETGRLDFKYAIPFGKFGFFAYNGSRFSMVDAEGKDRCKEDFYDVNVSYVSRFSSLSTDYFNPSAVANAIADLISDKTIGDYKLGAAPGTIIKNGSPEDYTYRNSLKLDGLDKEGFRYRLEGEGYFTGNIALSDWNYYDYSYSYQWNPESKLAMITIAIHTQAEWGKDGNEAIIAALKDKGFKVVKKGKADDNPTAMLTKGNVAVMATAESQGTSGGLVFLDLSNEQAKDAYNRLLDTVQASNGSDDPVEEVAVVEEKKAVDSAVVAE